MTLLKLLLKFLILWHRQCSIVNGKWLADTSVKYTGVDTSVKYTGVPATRRLPRADNSVIVPRANTYVPSCTDCIQRQTWEGMRFVHCKWDLYAVAYRRWSGGGGQSGRRYWISLLYWAWNAKISIESQLLMGLWGVSNLPVSQELTPGMHTSMPPLTVGPWWSDLPSNYTTRLCRWVPLCLSATNIFRPSRHGMYLLLNTVVYSPSYKCLPSTSQENLLTKSRRFSTTASIAWEPASSPLATHANVAGSFFFSKKREASRKMGVPNYKKSLLSSFRQSRSVIRLFLDFPRHA